MRNIAPPPRQRPDLTHVRSNTQVAWLSPARKILSNIRVSRHIGMQQGVGGLRVVDLVAVEMIKRPATVGFISVPRNPLRPDVPKFSK
jgi:hypothetical protein